MKPQREPPLAVTCIAGAAIIMLVGWGACDLLGWPFSPPRIVACAIIAGLYCLRARQRRTERLACARNEHQMQDHKRRVFLYPAEGIFSSRCVADRAEEVYQRCSLCGYETEPEIRNREGLNGLTLSGDRWDRLKSEGRLAQ